MFEVEPDCSSPMSPSALLDCEGGKEKKVLRES